MRLDITTDEANLISGALNVSSVLRNTLAPVTPEQLELGRRERELGWRVLNAVAVSDQVDTTQPQVDQLIEAVRAFVAAQEPTDRGDFAADRFETVKHALAAIGRWTVGDLGKLPPRAPTIVLVFAEGDFDDAAQYDSELEARAFADGVSHGANLYGAGGCSAYVMPGDEESMRATEDRDEVMRALAAWHKTTGGAE